MTDPSALSQAAGFVAFALAAATIAWGINRATNRAPIHEPEPSRLDTLNGVGRHCSYGGCNARVQIHLAVGHDDWWLFCLEHGTPYLTLRSAGEAS